MNAEHDEARERAELGSLLPAPAEPELPADRHRLLRGHLMNEITEAPRPAPRRNRRFGRLALPALAGGLALAVVLADGGAGAPTAPPAAEGAPLNVAPVAVAKVLDHAAQVAESKPATAVTGGQFTYVKSLVAFSSMNAAAGAASDVTHDAPHQRELWLSVDGKQWGVLIEAGWKPVPAEPRGGKDKSRSGEPAPRADGGQWLEPNLRPGLNGPTYEYLAALPTDPETLLRKVYKETKGQGQTPDQEAFVTIGDLLREQLAPPAVSAALYRAAARIPGVSALDDAVDASGRHGVAVALVHGGVRTEWIFDRSSYEFLGEREVVVDTGNVWGAPGTVVGQTAVLGRGVVDAAGERPQR